MEAHPSDDPRPATSHLVQVDLRGIVAVLSTNLYSTPEVVVRELLQNAADALTARALVEPETDRSAWSITFSAQASSSSATLVVEDDGIGLTEAEVHTFLSTIGSSSKRDALEFARSEFLGSFGVGLLSCFCVASEVTVITRSAQGGPAVRWVGRDDGSYELHPAERTSAGSTVYLRLRRGYEHLAQTPDLARLIRRYAVHLPWTVRLEDSVAPLVLDPAAPPWSGLSSASVLSSEQLEPLLAWGSASLGARVSDAVVLRSSSTGTEGVAFVLSDPANPSARQNHRTTLKGMLVSESNASLLPEWAFFLRGSLDTRELVPTASRESLAEGEALELARTELGEQIKTWLGALSTQAPERFESLIHTHHLALKAVAVHNDDMYRAVGPHLPMETSTGERTLGELSGMGEVHYTRTRDEFRQILQVATAQGLCVVNAGYTYDAQLLDRLGLLHPDASARAVTPQDLVESFEEPLPIDADAALALQQRAEATLSAYRVETWVRVFNPRSLPALLLISPEQESARRREEVAERSDALWASLLAGPDDAPLGATSVLLLNWGNPLVRTLARATPAASAAALRLLHTQSLLLGHHPLGASERRALTQSIEDVLVLLETSLTDPESPEL